MDGVVLALGGLAFVLFLAAFEWWAIANGRPTISKRIHDLGTGATLVIVIACFVLGVLADHFWGNFCG